MADNRPFAATDEVRRLASEGSLAEEFRNAAPDRQRWLRAGGGEIAGSLLFLRLTRPVERKRGHHRCAAGLRQLAPDCLDRFHDDLDAVLTHLFTYADEPIDNLEGWLTTRLRRATVDGHRRRRGEAGALQRPRVPVWLAGALDHDAWRVELATAILEWAGNTATAGAWLWPLSAWVTRRATRTGDHTAGETVVAREIEIVLTAMRRRPAWYDKNVERPLGRKRAPVWFPSRNPDGTHAEPDPLVIAPHERIDGLLRQLAARAIEVMEQRITRGEDPAVVVADVLRKVFGDVPAAYGADVAPGTGEAGPDQVLVLIDDPDRMDRITATVIELISGNRPPGS
ncbi:hypothetical protein Ait01nite_082330 [Actinoplanes italicus]|uniref:Uncharacterized protein n=1 Tax=Actinoplanes italicus TaxID=113567 RepID=A0A2T0K321_9ACTN|nr:hypothetical protein [Actinoplanes italicus]PRX17254.1 hypothetical protein CLV67_11630 [Actinoplanes italicus]GIE35188.1 hypothetical protein Ait01nite_082330 [Actinoplanes italicus]